MEAVTFQPIVKPQDAAILGTNPNATRYGWTPFKDINLYSAFGTPDHYIQPVHSPFHRIVPKNQLVPFDTFSYTMMEPVTSQGEVTPLGPAGMVQVAMTVTAVEAATQLVPTYGGMGYTILNSLEGMAYEDAFRIFQVVQPFSYTLAQLQHELPAADERIDSLDAMDFGNGVIVEPLLSDSERSIARRLRDEMLGGAKTAYNYALEIYSASRDGFTQKRNGAESGKTTLDALDRYLAETLELPLPSAVEDSSRTASVIPDDVKAKLDFLVDRQISADKDAEIERLRAELAAIEAANKHGNDIQANSSLAAADTSDIKLGDTIIVNGEYGVVSRRPFGRIYAIFGDEERHVKPEDIQG